MTDPADLPAPSPAQTPSVVALASRIGNPAPARVIAIANQKGGVGKTTTAINLGTALAATGERVLIIDLDPQGNASTALGIDHHADIPSVYDVLIDGKNLSDVVQPVDGFETLWCAPATLDLAGIGQELTGVGVAEAIEDSLAQLERYWDPRGDPPAYSSDVRGTRMGGDRYYDDNAWIGLALVQLERMLPGSGFLDRAEALFHFAVSGWDPRAVPHPGGVFWVEQGWGLGARNHDRNGECRRNRVSVAERTSHAYENSQQDRSRRCCQRGAKRPWIRRAERGVSRVAGRSRAR